MEEEEYIWRLNGSDIIAHISKDWGKQLHLLCSSAEDYKNWNKLLTSKFKGITLKKDTKIYPYLLTLRLETSDKSSGGYRRDELLFPGIYLPASSTSYPYKFLFREVGISYDKFEIMDERTKLVANKGVVPVSTVDLYKLSLAKDM